MTNIEERKAKPLFMRGPSLGTRFVLLCITAIAMMVLDARLEHLSAIRSGLAVVVHPLRVAVDLPFSFASWAHATLRERYALLRENELLRAAQLDASVRLQRLEALEAENARLRALMESSAKVADRVLVSEILSVDLDAIRHRIMIDKGTRQGAFLGQALLSASGIVGQITRAEPFASEAILISDPGHALPVEVNRNGLRTIAVGTGDITRLSLPFLPNNADIENGDLLVSSGLGGGFPAGYPVAIVEEVRRDRGEPFAAVSAAPVAALNRTREVLLVWPAARTPDDGDGPRPDETADGKLAGAGP